jgi:hypothetical protein
MPEGAIPAISPDELEHRERARFSRYRRELIDLAPPPAAKRLRPFVNAIVESPELADRRFRQRLANLFAVALGPQEDES